MESPCSRLSPLPEPLLEAISLRKFIVIYGPPATGKTRIAFDVARAAACAGLKVLLIATESGTATYARALPFPMPEGVEIYIALSVDQLIDLVVRGSSEGKYIVIDSINWPFRSAPQVSVQALSMVAALLRRGGGLAIGQVSESEEGITMALGEWVLPWAHVAGITRRVQCKGSQPCGVLEFLKPKHALLRYELIREGVRWTGQA